MLTGDGLKKARSAYKDLPHSGEISYQLAKLVGLREDDKDCRLLTLRETAWAVMKQLKDFSPCLIGSVSTGNIRQNSDIDLHVFTDDLDELLLHLQSLPWDYEIDKVLIKRAEGLKKYTHVYLQADLPVELSVYPVLEKRMSSRSSTDGKPIIKAKN